MLMLQRLTHIGMYLGTYLSNKCDMVDHTTCLYEERRNHFFVGRTVVTLIK